MAFEYTSERRDAILIESLITTRAMLNVLLSERAEQLAEANQTRWPDELKKLEEKVENERQIIIDSLAGNSSENNIYTMFDFVPKA